MEKWHTLEANEIKIIFSLIDAGRTIQEMSNLLGIPATQVEWLSEKRTNIKVCFRECQELQRRLEWFIGGKK